MQEKVKEEIIGLHNRTDGNHSEYFPFEEVRSDLILGFEVYCLVESEALLLSAYGRTLRLIDYRSFEVLDELDIGVLVGEEGSGLGEIIRVEGIVTPRGRIEALVTDNGFNVVRVELTDLGGSGGFGGRDEAGIDGNGEGLNQRLLRNQGSEGGGKIWKMKFLGIAWLEGIDLGVKKTEKATAEAAQMLRFRPGVDLGIKNSTRTFFIRKNRPGQKSPLIQNRGNQQGESQPQDPSESIFSCQIGQFQPKSTNPKKSTYRFKDTLLMRYQTPQSADDGHEDDNQSESEQEDPQTQIMEIFEPGQNQVSRPLRVALVVGSVLHLTTVSLSSKKIIARRSIDLSPYLVQEQVQEDDFGEFGDEDEPDAVNPDGVYYHEAWDKLFLLLEDQRNKILVITGLGNRLTRIGVEVVEVEGANIIAGLNWQKSLQEVWGGEAGQNQSFFAFGDFHDKRVIAARIEFLDTLKNRDNSHQSTIYLQEQLKIKNYKNRNFDFIFEELSQPLVYTTPEGATMLSLCADDSLVQLDCKKMKISKISQRAFLTSADVHRVQNTSIYINLSIDKRILTIFEFDQKTSFLAVKGVLRVEELISDNEYNPDRMFMGLFPVPPTLDPKNRLVVTTCHTSEEEGHTKPVALYKTVLDPENHYRPVRALSGFFEVEKFSEDLVERLGYDCERAEVREIGCVLGWPGIVFCGVKIWTSGAEKSVLGCFELDQATKEARLIGFKELIYPDNSPNLAKFNICDFGQNEVIVYPSYLHKRAGDNAEYTRKRLVVKISLKNDQNDPKVKFDQIAKNNDFEGSSRIGSLTKLYFDREGAQVLQIQILGFMIQIRIYDRFLGLKRILTVDQTIINLGDFGFDIIAEVYRQRFILIGFDHIYIIIDSKPKNAPEKVLERGDGAETSNLIAELCLNYRKTDIIDPYFYKEEFENLTFFRMKNDTLIHYDINQLIDKLLER